MEALVTVREHRAHRRRCRQLLQQVPMPDRFSLEDFCEQVAEHRGRPLYLLPDPRQSPPQERTCGAWWATSVADFVFVDPEVSPLHREHIVLHELGHMLCGHAPREATRAQKMAYLFPQSGSEVAELMLGRTIYDTPIEVEAEIYASMAGARIRLRSATPPPAQAFVPRGVPAAPSPVLQALSQMLGVPEPGGS